MRSHVDCLHLLTRAMVIACLVLTLRSACADDARLELRPGDKIVLVGNTLAERMQYPGFNHFETLLHGRFTKHDLVVRNLGWSADELMLRPRSKDFQDHGHRLEDHKPDVMLLFFGFNESFGGELGLPIFEKDLEEYLTSLLSTKYNGKEPPRVAVISPIAHEDLGNPDLPNGAVNNKHLALYTSVMKQIAAKKNVPFVDLFAPSKRLYERESKPLTINGVHLNEFGDALVGEVLDEGLFGPRGPSASDLSALQAAIEEKNLQFWYDYRAINGYYIYGGRKEPFGVVNFPAEFAKLRKMIANRDKRVWAIAKGEPVSNSIDDSNTGEFTKIETNYADPVNLLTPEQEMASFKVADGYEVNLFASEVDMPDLQKPVQLAFDGRGRMWVTTMPHYPMYLPGEAINDKLLILEDVDHDGKADKQTVFADKLHVPTGLELGMGGAYVAQQPNLMFLRDTNGDDKADERSLVLHGFDSGDSHHSISAFEWDPAGALYMMEGTFHHSQVETPYGPQRVANAGIFRYDPRVEKLNIHVSYGFANPWGQTWDDWGQYFVADASGGANYYGTAFSGDIDYPHKRNGMRQFLDMQYRPTSGCEFVSSRHFPEEGQGDYLLNNCIGFQGVARYRVKETGSGFFAEPVEPLLTSSDRNFRPVDLQFGPDGALYVIDWYNPLVGHMQHNIRDPKRDHTHGRIWRITAKNRPLLKPAMLAGAPIPALLDQLKEYEYRTRYRARRELRMYPTSQVLPAIQTWIAGLDKNDAGYVHHLLEALWVQQQHNRVDRDLLSQLLTSSEPKARAAAVHVLCDVRDQFPDVLALLAKAIEDEHPRVRLEAIRAASFFKGGDAEKALELTLAALLHDTDEYIDYTLKETTETLERRVQAFKDPAKAERVVSFGSDPSPQEIKDQSIIARQRKQLEELEKKKQSN